MVMKVAIVGCGAIGIRHFQSIYNQSVKNVIVDVFDLDASRLASVKSSIEIQKKNVDFSLYQNLNKVHTEYDVTIVATTANFRLQAVRDFLSFHKTKYFILEKVVFNKEEDFLSYEIINKNNQENTFINCSLRCTDFYIGFKKDILSSEKIVSFNVSGKSWGLGCNTIHFLDLFSYFLDDQLVEITNCTVKDVIPAKRSNYIELIGEISGRAESSKFTFDCDYGDFDLKIKIITDKHEYVFNDTNDGLVVESTNSDFENRVVHMPYQSQMTFGVVESLYLKGVCPLPTYESNKKLHLLMLKAFHSEIKSEYEFCNIT